MVTFIDDTIQNHRKQYGYVDEEWHLQQLIEQYIDANMYEQNDDIILMIILYYIENIYIEDNENAKMQELSEGIMKHGILLHISLSKYSYCECT